MSIFHKSEQRVSCLIIMPRPRPQDIIFEDSELKKLISNFSVNMELVRKYRNYTQLDVAKRSKLSLTTIADIEQKRVQDIRLSTITAIAKALNTSPLILQSKKMNLKKLK